VAWVIGLALACLIGALLWLQGWLMLYVLREIWRG
jgi:hypothetical protein